MAIDRARQLGTWKPDWYNSLGSELPLTSKDLAGGRVLTFSPDIYLYEQMEPSECGGYIDIFGTPPIDTWMVYVNDQIWEPGGALLACVPGVFVSGVQLAMNVNTTGSLRWLEEMPGELAAKFRCASA